MIKFDNVTGAKSGKTIALLTLISHQPGPYEAKSQSLFTGIEVVWSKYYNDPKTFIEYSTVIDYV